MEKKIEIIIEEMNRSKQNGEETWEKMMNSERGSKEEKKYAIEYLENESYFDGFAFALEAMGVAFKVIEKQVSLRKAG